MRRLRIAIVALFILSGISFVGYNVISRLAEDHTPPRSAVIRIQCQSAWRMKKSMRRFLAE